MRTKRFDFNFSYDLRNFLLWYGNFLIYQTTKTVSDNEKAKK